jgi:hypothetical protein
MVSTVCLYCGFWFVDEVACLGGEFKFMVPDWGDQVNSGIGLSHWPLSYMGRYDNPMPETTISPSKGLWIWLLVSQIFYARDSTNWPRSRILYSKDDPVEVAGRRKSARFSPLYFMRAPKHPFIVLVNRPQHQFPLPSSFNDILETCLYHPSICTLLHVFHPFHPLLLLIH